MQHRLLEIDFFSFSLKIIVSDHILAHFQCLNNRQIADILCKGKDKTKRNDEI